MHAPAFDSRPARFTLRAALPADFEFAEALTRTNMHDYYRRHGLMWRRDMFLASWNESENYVIECGGAAVGTLRIDDEGAALHVRDVHVIPTFRNRGAGTFALRAAYEFARRRGYRMLQLRVFVDNPAIALYTRLGFRLTNSDGEFRGIQRMACPIRSDGGTGGVHEQA